MWIDTGELVKLIEKLDETQSALQAYFADDTNDEEHLRKVGERLAEMRLALYRDIAQADKPQP